jgi:tRNA threonylcarbamoyladenosine biosynthesis protein TsaB
MGDLYLGIDSATPYLSLALWSPDRGALAQRIELLERAHAARIVGELEQLFAVAGRDRRDLTAIACGVGPGSYTGLRVGLATASGLARALGVPLVGYDTLAAMAASTLAPGEVGIAALDARREHVYAGVYRNDGPRIATLTPAAKIARSALPSLHPGARPIEGVAPDPVTIARSVTEGAPAEARYL